MRKTFLACAAVLAATSLSAHAQGFLAAEPRWYVEASGGQSQTSNELVHNRESTITLATDVHTDFDSKDSAWKVGGGYRLLPWLALELNYADLGRVSLHTTLMGGDPPAPAAIAIDRKVTGFGLDAVFSAPVAAGFRVYGRVGAFRSHLETSSQLSGNIVFTSGNPADTYRSVTLDETVGRAGLGARWEAWRNGGIHLEWERYFSIGKKFEVGGTGTTGEADIDAVWLGVSQSF